MSRELLLALDLGTTGVRALIVEPGGTIRAREYRALSAVYPEPGRVEQDPEEMWERSLEVLGKALSGAGCDVRDVAGIGVVTQRSTTIAWDAGTGRPLAPAIGWQDQRTAPRVAWFRERGIPLNTLASATKFEWWLQHDDAIRDAAARGTLRLGTPESWLTYRLTGGTSHVTDPGHASCTALYDAARGEWSPGLLSLFGVAQETLPTVVATSEVVGETPARLLGAAIPVAARAGDQQAATFAQGVHASGQAKLTLGTSAMLDLHTGPEASEAPPGSYALCLWRLADGTNAFCHEGTVITAGSAVEWLVELGLLREVAALDQVAGSVVDAGGAAFVPALQGLGTPFLEEGVRGLLGGLTRGTRGAHLVRATLVGIAQRCVDVCETLACTGSPLRVDGGLARSELLLQILSDLLGQEVWRAAETETTALGAAHLAGLATGIFDAAETCHLNTGPPTRFEPAIAEEARLSARAEWRRVLERARDGQ